MPKRTELFRDSRVSKRSPSDSYPFTAHHEPTESLQGRLVPHELSSLLCTLVSAWVMSVLISVMMGVMRKLASAFELAGLPHPTPLANICPSNGVVFAKRPQDCKYLATSQKNWQNPRGSTDRASTGKGFVSHVADSQKSLLVGRRAEHRTVSVFLTPPLGFRIGTTPYPDVADSPERERVDEG